MDSNVETTLETLLLPKSCAYFILNTVASIFLDRNKMSGRRDLNNIWYSAGVPNFLSAGPEKHVDFLRGRLSFRLLHSLCQRCCTK